MTDKEVCRLRLVAADDRLKAACTTHACTVFSHIKDADKRALWIKVLTANLVAAAH